MFDLNDFYSVNRKLVFIAVLVPAICILIPNIGYLIMGPAINLIMFSHKKFFRLLPVSFEISPLVSIFGYTLFGIWTGVVAGAISVVAGILWAGTFHPWNYVRLPAILLLNFVFVISVQKSIVFFAFLIIFYNLLLFVIYQVTGMPIFNNLSHQASNIIVNISLLNILI